MLGAVTRWSNPSPSACELQDSKQRSSIVYLTDIKSRGYYETLNQDY